MKITKVVMLFLLIVFSFCSNVPTSVAAEKNNSEQNFQQTINEGNSVTVASIPVHNEEEANGIIEKIESMSPVTVQVFRKSNNLSETFGTQAVEVAEVKAQPTYAFVKKSSLQGYIQVSLRIWVENGDIGTWIRNVKGYAAAATDVEGIRMPINYVNYLPLKQVTVTEEDDIKMDYDTDLILVEGYVTVSLTGGWSDADIFFDWEKDL